MALRGIAFVILFLRPSDGEVGTEAATAFCATSASGRKRRRRFVRRRRRDGNGDGVLRDVGVGTEDGDGVLRDVGVGTEAAA